MKRLHDRVNIIPVLAKADTMTPEECGQFKRTVSIVLTNFILIQYVVIKNSKHLMPDFQFFILKDPVKKKKIET